MDPEQQLFNERVNKLNEIKAQGVNPYAYSYNQTNHASEIKTKYSKLVEHEKTADVVSIAGRLLTKRDMGKAAFATISDQTETIQIYASIDNLGDSYKLFKKTDIGDIIGFKGIVFKTKTGEITVEAKEFTLLTKSLRPLPDKFHGIKDPEVKYRERHLDLATNKETRDILTKRALIAKHIREFFDSKGFLEVETPLLQTTYGGANAKPFITHINAWDMKMYLSISPELYLKRLLVGGYEKVYTMCKNFRNEGVDYKHNPEFTMVEAYQAYADYEDMNKLIEECYEYVCKKINGTTKLKTEVEGKEVILDFKAPWPRKTMAQVINDILKIDIMKLSKDELEEYCIKEDIEIKGMSWGELVLSIFDEKIESKIIQPTHIIDRPKESSPLCKPHRKDDRLIEQNEPIGLGMELGNIYSELNDPILQRKLLEEQAQKLRAGNSEAHPMDEDFVRAIEIGMPPAGGLGFGVDRMALLILGQHSIRDVIFFPTMKPLQENEPKKP